jgi:putative ABC transport system permease protein
LNQDATAPFTANLAVNSPSFGAGQISPGILSELRALPQVTQAVAVGEGPMVLNHASTTVTNTDVDGVAQVVKVRTIRGSLPALGSSGLAISRAQADTSGWKLGTTLQATFSDATTARLTVRAIYDTNQLLGDVVLPSALWAQHTTQPAAKTVFIRTSPGVTSAQARAAINPIAKRFSGDVQDQAQYAAATSSGLNFVLGIVYALLGLAIVIALLGIANTLSLAVHERRREIGLLRAVGETRPQVRSVLRLEAVLVAAFGTLLGLVVGSYLGWSLFEATAEAGARFTLPVMPLIIIAALGAFAGVLAAWRPARRASRLAILDAITVQ